MSIADPETYIATGSAGLEFAVASNVVTLPANTSGQTSIAITSGTTKIFAARTKTYTVSPLTVWLWAFGTNRPAFSGSAIMVGKVTCVGSAGEVSATQKATLIFE